MKLLRVDRSVKIIRWSQALSHTTYFVMNQLVTRSHRTSVDKLVENQPVMGVVKKELIPFENAVADVAGDGGGTGHTAC
jgi:hypothetical protein